MKLSNTLPSSLQRELDRIAGGEWQPTPLEVQYECDGCQDLGLIGFDVNPGHELFGKLFPCPDCARGQQYLQNQWDIRLAVAKLPDLYKKLTFDSWAALPEKAKDGKRKAHALAELFVLSPDHKVSMAEVYARCGREFKKRDVVRNSIIFHGVPGVGKTGLAAAIVNDMLAQQKPILYIRVQDFIEELKGTFSKGRNVKNVQDGLSDSSRELTMMVKRAPRLVLDEFNMAGYSDWRSSVVEDVVRYRHGYSLPTIFTCNSNPVELKAEWGERTFAVLFAMAHWSPMEGAVLRDMRQMDEVF